MREVPARASRSLGHFLGALVAWAGVVLQVVDGILNSDPFIVYTSPTSQPCRFTELSCHTWFAPVGSVANAAFQRAASWRRPALVGRRQDQPLVAQSSSPISLATTRKPPVQRV